MATSTLSSIVEQNLALLFAPGERDEVRKLLVTECGQNIPAWQTAGLNRLRCAVLKLSDGDLGKLRQSIDLAKKDFRDVLTPAEFGEAESYKSWKPERRW